MLGVVRSPDFIARAAHLRRGCLLTLRALCVAGIGLLCDIDAQAQMCSQFLKCPSGYQCRKFIPGAATGNCVKGGPALGSKDKEKEPPPSCETISSRQECEKEEHCNWPAITDACVLKCDQRENDLDCQRPGMCLWVPQTSRCISRLPPAKPKP